MNLLSGDLLALLSGMSWGFTNVILRRGRVGSAATTKSVLYQVATATILLGAFAAATGQTRVELSVMTILSLFFQTLIIAISSYLVWFWMPRHYLTSEETSIAGTRNRRNCRQQRGCHSAIMRRMSEQRCRLYGLMSQ